MIHYEKPLCECCFLAMESSIATSQFGPSDKPTEDFGKPVSDDDNWS